MTRMRFLAEKVRLEGRDFLEILAIWAGGFVGLEVLGNLLNLFLREGEELYVPIAPLLLLIFGAVFLVLLIAVRFTMTFQLGVQMSVTRRRMLLGEWTVSLLETVFTLALIYLAFWIDEWMVSPLWGGMLPEDHLLHVIPWWVWPLVGAGTLLLGYVSGALMCRYGPKGLWGVWGAFMALGLLMQFVDDAVFNAVIDVIAVHGVSISVGGILLAVALLIFTTVQMLRIPVK